MNSQMILFILCLLVILIIVCQTLERLFQEIQELRRDNRALMEALSRKEGSPMIFTPPETKPSAGWFDGKQRLIVKSEKS